MRVREWYGWHFPELAKIVNDNFQYARVVMLAKDKKNINDDMLEDLKEIVGEPEIADQVNYFQGLVPLGTQSVLHSGHYFHSASHLPIAQ